MAMIRIRIAGNDSSMSAIHMMRLSIAWKYTAEKPVAMPITNAMAALATPTSKLMRRPYRIAESISLPLSSVPSQYVVPALEVEPGGSSPSEAEDCAGSYGFCEATSGARSATAIIMASSAIPNTASGRDNSSVAPR